MVQNRNFCLGSYVAISLPNSKLCFKIPAIIKGILDVASQSINKPKGGERKC